MMKQSENFVTIEGILNEINLEHGSYVKNGANVNCIRGNVVIKTTQMINNELRPLEIPVYTFVTQYKNNGELNPAYTAAEKIMTDYKSVAAFGEENANYVRITAKDSIRMNEYYNQKGQLVAYPRINASFMTIISKENCNPCATFSVNMFIKSIAPEMNSEGIETGRMKLEGCVVGYNDKVDVVPFYSVNENVANAIEGQWKVGDTVRATGYLNFSSTTQVETIEQAFGAPITRNRTTSVSELLINGGSEPMTGDFAYTLEEMKEAMAKRALGLEALKNRAQSNATTKPAPARESKSIFNDIGF